MQCMEENGREILHIAIGFGGNNNPQREKINFYTIEQILTCQKSNFLSLASHRNHCERNGESTIKELYEFEGIVIGKKSIENSINSTIEFKLFLRSSLSLAFSCAEI